MSLILDDGHITDPDVSTAGSPTLLGIISLLLFWVVVSYLMNISILLSLFVSYQQNLITFITAFFRFLFFSPMLLIMSFPNLNKGFLPELLGASLVLGFLSLASKTFSRILLFISLFLYIFLFFMYRKLETIPSLNLLFRTQPRYSFSFVILGIIIMVTLFPVLLANFKNHTLSGKAFFWLTLKWGLVVFLIQGIYFYLLTNNR